MRLFDLIYNMVEIKSWPTFVVKNQRLFIMKKSFSLTHIIKEAYVISMIATPVKCWFVNNYVNRD